MSDKASKNELANDYESTISLQQINPNPASDHIVRAKLQTVLESRIFQLVIIFLVVIDLLIVTTELTSTLDVVVMDNEEKHESFMKHMHLASILVLSLFMIEITVRVWVYRKRFFKDWYEVFDGIVITTSFVLDIITFIPIIPTSAAELIIIARLWRVARISHANGALRSMHASQGDLIIQLKNDIATLTKELDDLKSNIADGDTTNSACQDEPD